jgi:uncharacterized membrane protein
MTASVAFTVISIAVLAVVAIVVFLVRGKRAENRITPLASLAFAFILAGFMETCQVFLLAQSVTCRVGLTRL